MNRDREYGRTTITVPSELKKKMKLLRGQVNWSAVACLAFEAKIEEIGPIEEIENVDAAIQRMKDLQPQSADAGNDSAGHAAGIRWALNQATPQQLAKIEQLRDSMSENQWNERLLNRDGIHDLTECIGPDPDELDQPNWRRGPRSHRPGHRSFDHFPGHKDGRSVWRSILDSRPGHPGFFLAFADGALEIWKQIKDQL